MRERWLKGWMGLALLLVISAGCDKGNRLPANKPEPRSAIKTKAGNNSADDAPAASNVDARQPESKIIRASNQAHASVLLTAAELTMPEVLLTETHAAACRVKVGDAMPEIALPDLTGQEQNLSKLLGEKLTVVVFWTGSHAYAVQQLGDLGPDIVAPYGSLGVKVVAIDEQDTPEAAKQIVEKTAADFPILIDAEGAALAAVGTQKLPRTYLLDPAGKILWFDIEYSRSTRRELQRAIRSMLDLQ